MTLKCCICNRNFSPAFPRRYPDFPGYCDECGELEEETRPDDPLESRIDNLKIGESLFCPVTQCDPRPWETLKTKIKRPRWTYLANSLCVHRVLKGDMYINEQNVIDFESSDGARLFKTFTFETLGLDLKFTGVGT